MGSSKVNRPEIYRRDNKKCHVCHCKIKSIQEMTLDHLVPSSRGGPDVEWNVAASHAKCNNIRGNGRFETHKSRVAWDVYKAMYPRQAFGG